MALSDINISELNDECICKLIEKKYFDSDKVAAQFAANYALAEMDLTSYGRLDEYKPKNGYKNNKWHTHDFDGNRFLRNLIKLYYPNVEDEDRALRAVISIGLDKILDHINESRGKWNITKLFI